VANGVGGGSKGEWWEELEARNVKSTLEANRYKKSHKNLNY